MLKRKNQLTNDSIDKMIRNYMNVDKLKFALLNIHIDTLRKYAKYVQITKVSRTKRGIIEILADYAHHKREEEEKEWNDYRTRIRIIKEVTQLPDVVLPIIQDFRPSQIIKVYNTHGAFCGLKDTGEIVTWGESVSGGDSSAIQHELQNIVRVHTSNSAFAAERKNGDIIIWGYEELCDREYVVVKNVRNIIYAPVVDTQYKNSCSGFMCVQKNGNVVKWGYKYKQIPLSRHDLVNTVQIFESTSCGPYAALQNDGSLIMWETSSDNNSNPHSFRYDVVCTIQNVEYAVANEKYTAVKLKDGSVVTQTGRNSNLIKNVRDVYCTSTSFLALRDDGLIVLWGILARKQLSYKVLPLDFSNVQIVPSSDSYAIKMTDGKLLTFGGTRGEYNGNEENIVLDTAAIQYDSNILYATEYDAYAVRLQNNNVVTFGITPFGGDSFDVQYYLRDIVQIAVLNGMYTSAFAALRSDGTVVTWGGKVSGDMFASIDINMSHIQNAVYIYSNSVEFAVLLENGDIVQMDGTIIN